jgi:preprotein translocase subunit SecG
MLNLIGIIISFLLILLIFLRLPQETVGLASFATKNNFLGSPSSAQRFLNLLTGVCIFVYFAIAIQLNLQIN